MCEYVIVERTKNPASVIYVPETLLTEILWESHMFYPHGIHTYVRLALPEIDKKLIYLRLRFCCTFPSCS